MIETREIRPRMLAIHSMFKTREELEPRLKRITQGDSIVIKTREIRHTLDVQNEGRVGSTSRFIDLILHSNTNITEASSWHVITRPMKLSYTVSIDMSGRLFQPT